jgi:hypothetical protein
MATLVAFLAKELFGLPLLSIIAAFTRGPAERNDVAKSDVSKSVDVVFMCISFNSLFTRV